MSITLLTGVPGSGKSYFAMNKICELLATHESFLIVSNIDGTNDKIFDRRYLYTKFTLEMLRNDNMKDYLPHLRAQHGLEPSAPIYLFIDECQNYYGPSCKDENAFFFLDYHRHYGVEIFLITQKDTKIRREVEALCETEIRGLPPSLGVLPGYFLYNHKCGGEIFEKIRLKKKQEVFKAYRSFQAGKVKGASYRIWLKVAIPMLIAGGAFYYTIHNLTNRSKKSIEDKKPEIQQPANIKEPLKIDESLQRSVAIPVDQPKKPDFNNLEKHILEYFDIIEYENWKVTYYDKFLKTKIKINFYEFINKYPPSPMNYSYAVSENILMIFVDGGKRVLEYRNDIKNVGVSRDPLITTIGKKM